MIISEKKDKKAEKYLVKDLPFPYTSKAQFERRLEVPLGMEWNTRATFQKATLPRVVKKVCFFSLLTIFADYDSDGEGHRAFGTPVLIFRYLSLVYCYLSVTCTQTPLVRFHELLPLRLGNYRSQLTPPMSNEQRIGGQYGEIRAEIDIASLNDFLRRECPRIKTPVEVKQFKVIPCLSNVCMSNDAHSLDRYVSKLTAPESVFDVSSRIRPIFSKIARESLKLWSATSSIYLASSLGGANM